MGKRLFHEVYASKDRTDALALPELMVVSEEDDKSTIDYTYHTVHKSYFSKEKPICPYCWNQHTMETKIRPRKFKDILPSDTGERNVIDLVFHQRYFRCENCHRIFREDTEFAEESCRYTNRLSDLLAEGTLTQTYEKVCNEYGVPASKTSVGIIMRRRLRMRYDQLPPLDTPNVLVIFVAYYYSNAAYPVILGLYGDTVRLIDVLSESSEMAYAAFFAELDRCKVKQVFVDPDEQMNNAVHAAFPNAQIMMSEECILRHVRNALKDVVKKEGSRCSVYQRYHTLCKPESYLFDYEQRQVMNTLKRRHRLAAAYNAYQELLQSMATGWNVRRIVEWVDDLPDYLKDYSDDGEQLEPLMEFDILKMILQLFEPQINAYLALKEKPPAAMGSSIMSIMDSLEEMPFCIYEVLHARMLLNVEQDYILKDGITYRMGVPIDRLTRKMHEITEQITKKKENERYGYKSED